MSKIRLYSVYVLLAFLLAVPVVLAQSAVPSPVPIPGPNFTAMGVGLIGAAFTILITPVLVWVARQGIPKLPRITLPFISIALGTAVTYVTALASGGHFNPLVGAALGGLGVTLREIVSTLGEHGIT